MQKQIKTKKSSKKTSRATSPHRSLSKSEFAFVEALEKIDFFDADTAQKILGWKKEKLYRIFFNLKRKGIMEEIDGRYRIVLFSREMDMLQLSCKLLWPSYVSFWSALNFYKFTEQLPRTLFLATTKKSKSIVFKDKKIVFVKLSPKRFFGYTKINDIVIASKEKALIDSLLFPRYSGGIAEVFKCLCNAWSEVEKNILIEYAFRIGNKSLLKRLGFLIELGNLKIDKKILESIKRKIGRGYSKLEPENSKKGEYEKKWGLIINIPREQLLEWRKIL